GIVGVAAGGRAVPLGISRMLVGDPAFGAEGFRYCGSILASAGDRVAHELFDPCEQAWRIANAAAEAFGLVGLNGIDLIAERGKYWYPVDVNPRYTASMELVERAYGISMFETHARACAGVLPRFDLEAARCRRAAVGKAVVYAPGDVQVGDTSAWLVAGDDIAGVGRHARIGEARNACAVGAAGFGDGTMTPDVRVHGRTAPLEQARDEATRILRAAQRPLVYLAADLSCEAQREAVALGDRLGAMLDSVSSGAAAGILAAQRRGRAGATLGEIRQRADVIVFWGTDPAERYPRFTSRYAVEPQGLQTPEGRRRRTVIAVDVGARRGPGDAAARVAVAPADEIDALGVMRATVQSRGATDDERFQSAVELARRMSAGRYVALVADGEPGAAPADGDVAEALVTLAQALNAPTRCALVVLRGGGN